MAKAINFADRRELVTRGSLLFEVARARGEGIQRGYKKALEDMRELGASEDLIQRMEERIDEYGFGS